MNQTVYNILLNSIYGTMGISGFILIIFIAFSMHSKGNGLSAISNSNLSLFENVKSYGVEKGMQKVCAIFTVLMFVAIIGYLVVVKIGVK